MGLDMYLKATGPNRGKKKKNTQSKQTVSKTPTPNSSWDETEQHWYRQFLETGTVEQLAYTAVQESHLRRKDKEKLDDKEKRIVNAIKKMCLGLYVLQKELGIDLRKMAQECAEKELEALIGTSEERWARSAKMGMVFSTHRRK